MWSVKCEVCEVQCTVWLTNGLQRQRCRGEALDGPAKVIPHSSHSPCARLWEESMNMNGYMFWCTWFLFYNLFNLEQTKHSFVAYAFRKFCISWRHCSKRGGGQFGSLQNVLKYNWVYTKPWSNLPPSGPKYAWSSLKFIQNVGGCDGDSQSHIGEDDKGFGHFWTVC